MILKPMFKYFGSKWRLSQKMPPPLEKGPIIEPFCGSAGYSLRYGADREVLLNDIGPAGELWTYILSATAEELRSLPIDELELGQDLRELDIPWGAKLLILHLGTSFLRKYTEDGCWRVAKYGTPALRKTYMRSRGGPINVEGSYWSSLSVEKIIQQREHMKRWSITHLDYRDAPDIEGTWVIDPPYQVQYSTVYANDPLDYPALGSWCKARKGLVLVNENRGADWLPFKPLSLSVSSNCITTLKDSRPLEVMWTQGLLDDPFIL
jgi:hypothetical protein